jgi:hypothetical protein
VTQEIVDLNGNSIALASVVSDGILPQKFDLEQNCPNPFNPETVISYSLEEVGNVSLDVYNCLGQRVRILFTGNQPAGKHTSGLHGTDDAGAQLASGIICTGWRRRSATGGNGVVEVKEDQTKNRDRTNVNGGGSAAAKSLFDQEVVVFGSENF